MTNNPSTADLPDQAVGSFPLGPVYKDRVSALITLIDWPGNSPDLNPIKNCWAWMKTQLKDTHVNFMADLQAAINRL